MDEVFQAPQVVAGRGSETMFAPQEVQRMLALPSGKFDTNCLVCQLAALAMNILRLMGQRGLLGPAQD